MFWFCSRYHRGNERERSFGFRMRQHSVIGPITKPRSKKEKFLALSCSARRGALERKFEKETTFGYRTDYKNEKQEREAFGFIVLSTKRSPRANKTDSIIIVATRGRDRDQANH
mmetsp:Transcript_13532/g.28564  ORF Transcript_13532/g.28564 Transcript_13532/m.28564 type:complete len:114 (+) Transcript_13532:243-584(+)